jgi:hypothetical protein
MAFVQERLTRHQRQPQQRALPVFIEHDLNDLAKADCAARCKRDGPAGLRQLFDVRCAADLILDLTCDSLSFVDATAQDQPARAFGDVSPHQNDRESQHGAKAKQSLQGIACGMTAELRRTSDVSAPMMVPIQ